MDPIENLRRTCRVAQSLERHLYSWHASRAAPQTLPVDRWHDLESLYRRAALAHQHHLQAAAQHCQRRLKEGVLQFSRDMNDFVQQFRIRDHPTSCPSVRFLYEELTSLFEEFLRVEFDLPRKIITVCTERIVLGDLDLGPFEISLKFAELTLPQAYLITAVEPYPSAADCHVPHPHVSGSTLCEGEGQVAIRQALFEGRIGDFFMLIRQILRTYNSSSAYQALEAWHGTSCTDCGDVVNEDDRCDCERCGSGLCGRCVLSCVRCDQSLCAGCSTTCEVCSDRTCERCLSPCVACGNCCCEECLTNSRCSDCFEAPEENDHAHENDSAAASTLAKSSPTEAFTSSADTAFQPDGLGEATLPA